MDDLKVFFGEELFSQISAKLGDKKLIFDDGRMIPKHRLDEVSESLKSQKEINKNYEEQIKQLKEASGKDEALTKQISELQKAMKEQQATLEQKEISAKKSFAIKEGLLNQGVSDKEARELLSLKFDLSKIELDENGSVKGFDEFIKPMKENSALKNLFGEKKIVGQEHQKGIIPTGDYFTREQVQAMSQEQVNANLEKINKSIPTWKQKELNYGIR